MAVVTMNRPTLLELANQTNNGELIKIVEVLSVNNDIFKDSYWMEANQTTSHKTVRRLTLAYGNIRLINKGVPRETSKSIPITEGIIKYEARSEIDKDLVDMAPNPLGFRSGIDKGFLEGMTQKFCDIIFYDSTAGAPERIDGFANRMPKLLPTQRVIGCGGTGSDLTSVYAVQWGEDKVAFIYPRDSKTMGIHKRDLGELPIEDEDGNKFQGYVTLFKFDVGILVSDDRCIGRLCNIETTGTTNLFSPENMTLLLNRMKNRGQDAVLYMNSTVMSQIENAAMNKNNVIWPVTAPFGDTVTSFKGRPMRQIEQVLLTEDALTA